MSFRYRSEIRRPLALLKACLASVYRWAAPLRAVTRERGPELVATVPDFSRFSGSTMAFTLFDGVRAFLGL